MFRHNTIDLGERPRHTRLAFSLRVQCLTASHYDDPVLDFTPPEDSELDIEFDSEEFLALLARRIAPESQLGSAPAERIKAVLERLEQALPSDPLPGKPFCQEVCWFDQPARDRMRMSVRVLPDGKRIESYDNGGRIMKDALGRVFEVRSFFGDSLTFEYGSFGRLEGFTRFDCCGKAHSFGRRERHGVAVRDHEGRVRAAGESMTVDPWGCFYLHSFDGQYFCLDLVAGTHCERRRIVREEGGVDYVTAAFAHDGFRMAVMYSRSKPASRRRAVLYRFYGRDGTVVEFDSHESVKRFTPLRAVRPATRPVAESWLKRPQANTAWESVHAYLFRVS